MAVDTGVSIELHPIRDPDGQLQTYVTIEREITKSRRDNQRRDLVYNISRILGSSGSVPDLVERLMASVGGILDCVAGRYWATQDASAVQLRCGAAWHVGGRRW